MEFRSCLTLTSASIVNQAKCLFAEIRNLSEEEAIDTINKIKIELHKISPMKNEPVDLILWIPANNVEANDYNPNSVAPPEMKLLEVSILEDGFTQPIVTWKKEDGNREVVDGFHRNRVGKESKKVKERLKNYLPVTTVNDDRLDRGDRIAATIRHNRARGKHRIDAMSEIVIELKRRNWSDEKIARNLGMDADEILRLSQISGLAEMFKDREFSEAWESEKVNEIIESDDLEISSEKSIEDDE